MHPRHDTETNWNASTYIPAAGEIVIYDADSSYTYPRFKVGNGTTIVPNLPFSHTNELIAGVIRLDAAITPSAWTFSSGRYYYDISNSQVTVDMDVVEWNIEDATVQLSSVTVSPQNGYARVSTSVIPTQSWVIHIILATNMGSSTRKIEYPKMAIRTVRADIEPADWVHTTGTEYYAYVADVDLRREMTLLEWEADIGYDWPWIVDYQTENGYVKITTPNRITTTIKGNLTFGVDSVNLTVGLTGANVSSGSSLSLLDVYPIGSIYLSVNNVSPANLFGGTWEQLKDKFLLGAGDTYSVNSTGGSSTHKHTTQNHILTVSEIPAHTHGSKSLIGSVNARPMTNGTSSAFLNASGIIQLQSPGTPFDSGGFSFANTQGQQYGMKIDATHEHTSVGGGSGHNHGDTASASTMPPYLTVYMWKRVA